MYPRGGPRRKHRLQQSFYCHHGRLPNDRLGTVFAGTCLPTRCLQTVVYLSAYCTATAVLVRFEVCAQKWVYTPQYHPNLQSRTGFPNMPFPFRFSNYNSIRVSHPLTWKLFIFYTSLASCYFLSVLNIRSVFFSDTFNLCCFLNVVDRILQPIKENYLDSIHQTKLHIKLFNFEILTVLTLETNRPSSSECNIV
jgi:hypothetical protein